MAKNERKNGIIVDLYRNYGFIKSSDGQIYPFSITKEMLEQSDGVEYIVYSKDVNFIVEETFLRAEDILEAKEIHFDGMVNYEVRQSPEPYLKRVRSTFSCFNISIPSKERMDEDYLKNNNPRSLISNDFRGMFNLNSMEKILSEFHEEILKTEDDTLYEWLKLNGFQPYMLDYLVIGVFESRKTLKEKFGIEFDKQIKHSVKDIVLLNEIDKSFRSFLLKSILGIENSYKSLISRISTQEEGGKEIANKLVAYWESSTDRIKENQLKRATQKNKFLTYSNQYDYVRGESVVMIDDILDQIELSSLEGLLKKFDDFMLQTLKDGGRFFSPWVHDIVEEKEFLRSLTSIRNAAAHDRPIIPLLFSNEQNPNNILELSMNSMNHKLEEWKVYNIVLKFLQEEFQLQKVESEQYIFSLYNNIYRRAWFELNFIYNRFVGLFESELYNKFLENLEQVFSNKKYDEKDYKLVDIPDTKMSDATHSKSIYDILKMDYTLAVKVANHQIEKELPKKVEKFAKLACGKI